MMPELRPKERRLGVILPGMLLLRWPNISRRLLPLKVVRSTRSKREKGGLRKHGSGVKKVFMFVTESFWHSEGWTVRKEELMRAVLRRVAQTKSQWIIACHANMDQREFTCADRFDEAKVEGRAPPNNVSTYCTNRVGHCDIDNVLDCFIVDESLSDRMEKGDVVEDYGFLAP